MASTQLCLMTVNRCFVGNSGSISLEFPTLNMFPPCGESIGVLIPRMSPRSDRTNRKGIGLISSVCSYSEVRVSVVSRMCNRPTFRASWIVFLKAWFTIKWFRVVIICQLVSQCCVRGSVNCFSRLPLVRSVCICVRLWLWDWVGI